MFFMHGSQMSMFVIFLEMAKATVSFRSFFRCFSITLLSTGTVIIFAILSILSVRLSENKPSLFLLFSLGYFWVR
jgi:hypothetical protein